jgi:hypothetical protein
VVGLAGPLLCGNSNDSFVSSFSALFERKAWVVSSRQLAAGMPASNLKPAETGLLSPSTFFKGSTLIQYRLVEKIARVDC